MPDVVIIGECRLYLGDCLDVLPKLADGGVDAVVTDPPYNVGLNYEGDATADNKPEYQAWCIDWFVELRRICTGAVTISCGIVNLAMWCKIEDPHWVLCWWKPSGMGRSPVGFCNWEPMPMWGKTKGKGKCDVIRAPIIPNRALDGHPCPKPIEWGCGFVELLSEAGMIVCDPFMGLGTVGVACVRLGRKFIGIEKEPKYFDIACRRIENEVQNRQGRLWD